MKTKDIIPERCVWRVAIETFPDQERHKDMKCYFCRGYKGSAEKMNCNAYYPYSKLPIRLDEQPIDLWQESRMLKIINDYEDGV
jgi:hypothetical protein